MADDNFKLSLVLIHSSRNSDRQIDYDVAPLMKDVVKMRPRTRSIVDGLLLEIYDKLHTRRSSGDSDFCYSTSDGYPTNSPKLDKCSLRAKGVFELTRLLYEFELRLAVVTQELVKYLKQRDRLIGRRNKRYDVITASLQAISPKRRVDTRIRFSIEPFSGDNGFDQWHDAMKMVARLPGGIPKEFRRKLWLTLAEKHVQLRNVDWNTVHRVCFNDKSNPDDDDLGVQIVKDLHRTGCSLFCGQDAEHNQALLKRVLLAYARWNKAVGYCQGFNMLAAIILEVMERNEEDALKVMIYLIEGVLPESYFANSLRGLSVDMAVFRDLLRMRLPLLSRHLEHLQAETRDGTSGTSYEPPLTNVFTMQWFLTLFSNCLPKSTVLRVWDLIFLEGNEVLLRTALAIWDGLADRIMTVESADEFYSIMGVLTREMLEFGLMDANHLVKTICGMAPFPFPQLGELRDKYTYNITPFTAAVGVAKRGLRLFYSDDEDEAEEDQLAVAAWCFASVFPPQLSPNKAKEITGKRPSPTSGMYSLPNLGSSSHAQLVPGGNVSPSVNSPTTGTSLINPRYSFDPDKLSLDISALKQQYAKIRQRQKQAHVIMSAAGTRQQLCRQPAPSPIPQPVALNHLLLGKSPLVSKKCKPNLAIIIPQAKTIKTTMNKKADNKSSSRSSISEGSKHDRDNSGDEMSLSTSESGETLHWRDAKKDKHVKGKSETECEGSECTLALSNEDTEDDDVKSSSTSTELCDDDLGLELDDQPAADNIPIAKWEPAPSDIFQPEYSTEEMKIENRLQTSLGTSPEGNGSSSSSAHKAGVSSSESSTSQSPKNDQVMPLSWTEMQEVAKNSTSGNSSTSSSSPTAKTSASGEGRNASGDDLDDLKEAVAKLSLQRKNNDRKRTKQPKSTSSPTSPCSPNEVFAAGTTPGDTLFLRTIPVTTTFLMLSTPSKSQVKRTSSNGSDPDCSHDAENTKSDSKKVLKQQLTGKAFQFNPFPTPRRSSQIWSPSEVGMKLGLYETPPNTANKGPRGRKRNPKNS